jgi:hypothetical protein
MGYSQLAGRRAMKHIASDDRSYSARGTNRVPLRPGLEPSHYVCLQITNENLCP